MTDDAGAFRRALESAAKLLSRRDALEIELRARLERQGFDEITVEAVVEELRKRRFLDDRRTVDGTIVRLADERKFGRDRVVADLVGRGLDEDEARAAVANRSPEAERASALAALRKRYGAPIERAKMARYLAGRGFDEETIEEALREFGANTEEDL